jgi:hypothetical protein
MLTEEDITKMTKFSLGGGAKTNFYVLIQHCFTCHPSDSIVAEDARIDPRTVATLTLVRRSSHSTRSHSQDNFFCSLKTVQDIILGGHDCSCYST